jgi:hypothetical protein
MSSRFLKNVDQAHLSLPDEMALRGGSILAANCRKSLQFRSENLHGCKARKVWYSVMVKHITTILEAKEREGTIAARTRVSTDINQ